VAFTKNAMKPSFTRVLLKAILVARAKLLHRSQVYSLNVVRSACVDCASTRRWAIRCRRRVMGTRCSDRAPGALDVPLGRVLAQPVQV